MRLGRKEGTPSSRPWEAIQRRRVTPRAEGSVERTEEGQEDQ